MMQQVSIVGSRYSRLSDTVRYSSDTVRSLDLPSSHTDIAVASRHSGQQA